MNRWTNNGRTGAMRVLMITAIVSQLSIVITDYPSEAPTIRPHP
jgi:hypothetical protein